MRRLPLILLVLLPGMARAGEPWNPFRGAAEAAVPKLEELADWCAAEKLLEERSHVFEAILVFDPDHGAARKGLRYSRGRDGEWVRKRAFRRPKTTRPSLQEEFRSRRREILGDLVGKALEGLEERRATVTGPHRLRIFDDLGALLPEDQGIRDARGEVLHEDRWLLVETVNAARRTQELRAAASRLLASQPSPEAASLDAVDRAIGLPWTVALRTPELALVGTVPREDLVAAARVAGASGGLLREAFGRQIRVPEGARIFLLDGDDQKSVYLMRHPGMTPEWRRFLQGVLSGWTQKSSHLGVWATNGELRYDLVCRQTLSLLFRRHFHLGMKQGALHEATGLYLGYLLTGRRQVWFVAPSEYARADASLGQKLREAGADWIALARAMIEEGGSPDYPALLGLDVNAMTPTDLLHSYVLGVYLLSGAPKGRDGFLLAIGTGKHPEEAALENFGLTLPDLERRVRRWLEETTTVFGLSDRGG